MLPQHAMIEGEDDMVRKNMLTPEQFQNSGHTLVWGPIHTINHNFCLNKHLIRCLLIVMFVTLKPGDASVHTQYSKQATGKDEEFKQSERFVFFGFVVKSFPCILFLSKLAVCVSMSLRAEMRKRLLSPHF